MQSLCLRHSLPPLPSRLQRPAHRLMRCSAAATDKDREEVHDMKFSAFPKFSVPIGKFVQCMKKTRSMPPQAVREMTTLPEMVVFDLDYCLWPFWCEMYTTADKPRLYPGSMAVLKALQDASVKMALASRTPTPDVANAFIDKLGIRQLFCNVQLVPAANGFDQQSAQKDECHFPNIQRATGIDFADMVFFDDEVKNVHRVARLGTTAVLVDTQQGMTMPVLLDGLQQYARRKQAGASS